MQLSSQVAPGKAKHSLQLADLWALLQSVTVMYEGQVQPAVLTTLEKEIDATEMRSSAVAKFTPIHSFLFSAVGQLLYANSKALWRLRTHGDPDCCQNPLVQQQTIDLELDPSHIKQSSCACDGIVGHLLVPLNMPPVACSA